MRLVILLSRGTEPYFSRRYLHERFDLGASWLLDFNSFGSPVSSIRAAQTRSGGQPVVLASKCNRFPQLVRQNGIWIPGTAAYSGERDR